MSTDLSPTSGAGRQACYDARDAFHMCLGARGILRAVPLRVTLPCADDHKDVRSECLQQLAAYEQACLPSWVRADRAKILMHAFNVWFAGLQRKHFDEKRLKNRRPVVLSTTAPPAAK